MRFLLFLLLFPWLLTAQNIRDILAAENARFVAMTTRDSVHLPDLLHADLVYIHSNGLTESKADFVESVTTGRIVYKKTERSEVRATRYGRRMGIVNGVLHVEGIIKGTPFDLRLRYTAVYRRAGRQWRLLRWQSTKM